MTDDVSKNDITVCDRHDEDVPMVFTMAFKGAENWCPKCQATNGMFDGGTRRVPYNAVLFSVKEEVKNIASDYLSAQGILRGGGETKVAGVWVSARDLSDEKRAEIQKILNDGKDYDFHATALRLLDDR